MSEAELMPFPVLPVELIFLIFEHLVLQNPDSALDLVHVSKSVQEFIDPFLYATLIICGPYALHKLAFTIRYGTKPASFYRRHVKCFCVWLNKTIEDTTTEYDEFRIVLSACTGIKSVALGAQINLRGLPWETLTGMRRLSICVDTFPNSFATDPLCNFTNLTHLEIAASFDNNILTWSADSKLSTSGLTHLSLIDLGWEVDVERVLRHAERVLSSSSVVVCILFIENRVLKRFVSSQPMWYKEHEPSIVIGCGEFVESEHRYVLYRDFHDYDTFVEDWGRPPPVRVLDMWEMAEQISRSQKLLIEPKC